MAMKSTKSKQIFQLVAWLLILILLNFTGSYFFKRFDLTSEKRYTLNPATVEMLKNLDDEIYVKVYLEGDFNSAFTRLRNETREMLDEFRVYAKKGLNYEFINIYDQKNKGDIESVQRELYNKGIDPTELRIKTGKGEQTQVLFPGAVIYYKTREGVWQIFNKQDGIPAEQCVNNSVQNLEYGLSNSIRKIQETIRPRVAFIRGHHELDTSHTRDIYNALNEYYDVEYIRIKKRLKALKPYDAIVLAWPDSVVSEQDKFVIDQYVMNGGKVLWCLEPVYTNYDSLKLKGYTLGLNNNINLDDILFNYGARVNPALVQDMQCGFIPINRGFKGGSADLQMFPWIYKPMVMPQGNHPIVKNLGLIRFEFSGYIDTVGAPGIKKTILLESSKNSRIQAVPARISLSIVGSQLNETKFTNGNKPMAVLLEGSFKSNYQNRLTDTIANDSAIAFKAKSKPTSMIVIADGDIIKNDFNYQTMSISPLGYDKYMKQEFANKTFLLNCMNYLIDGPELMSVRTREVKLRLLDRKKIGLDNPLKWKMYNVLFPLVILIVSGTVLSSLRRKKFTSTNEKK
jgi:ABC-2 type transport system permease protein